MTGCWFEGYSLTPRLQGALERLLSPCPVPSAQAQVLINGDPPRGGRLPGGAAVCVWGGSVPVGRGSRDVAALPQGR